MTVQPSIVLPLFKLTILVTTQVASGSGISLAIDADNALWAWGSNGFGGLGQNNTVSKSSPVQVGTLTDWAQVSTAGLGSGIALKTDGTLWTWGSNSNGELGDNTTIDKSSPIQIGSLTNWAQVDAGAQCMGALKTTGTLWTWGEGDRGRTGHGDVVNRSSPVQVGALTNWAKLSMSAHGLAVKTDNTLWAWGYGGNGRLGDNSINNRSSPIQVGLFAPWEHISSGVGSLAITKDLSV